MSSARLGSRLAVPPGVPSVGLAPVEVPCVGLGPVEIPRVGLVRNRESVPWEILQ
jgi:hypothetical protein